ncbi:MAG: hypothetical protein HRT92_04855 [Piscirickettsiaceae bacterium]|nr:hypothetical protein [Piscirickettsiaceae bacterium]
MKLLIVDDDQSKINAIKSEILSLDSSISDSDICQATDASQARIILSKTYFDVMFLDVLLPARKDENATGDVSVELLRQIIDDGTCQAPSRIIGMTACSDALEKHRDKFIGLASQILLITPGVDDWKCSIKSLLNLFRNAENAQSTYDYDICILTALRRPELEAVLATWEAKLEPEELLAEGLLTAKGILNINGVEKKVVFSHLNQMGLVAAAHATEILIQKFKPRMLLMTGICGGFSDKVNIGDVIVADKSWDWQAGKWDDNGTLQSASDQKEASKKFVTISHTIEEKLKLFQSEYSGNVPPDVSKLIVGPMVSGSSVISSPEIQKIFRSQHRKMVAVDMECYGVYYAVALTGGPTPQVICIKSVSDLADSSKSDDFQEYCSYISARTALEIVKKNEHNGD